MRHISIFRKPALSVTADARPSRGVRVSLVLLVLCMVCCTISSFAWAQSNLKPLHAKSSAGPRLGLKVRAFMNRKVLTPHGKADLKKIRPKLNMGGRSSAEIARQAKAQLARAEELVRQAYKAGVSSSQRATLLKRAGVSYTAWEEGVQALIKTRELHTPAGEAWIGVYREWALKTEEALQLQLHAAAKHGHPGKDAVRIYSGSAPQGEIDRAVATLHQTDPLTFQSLIKGAWMDKYRGARPGQKSDLLTHNPLALLAHKWGNQKRADAPRKLRSYRPRPTPLWPATWRPRSYKVRDEVAYVWVPGIVRTYTDFQPQILSQLDNGSLALCARTKTNRNPYQNAYAVAEAINRARRITKNPDVKVVLVGQSQGNASLYAFSQAEGRTPAEAAMFAELRKNVVHIHDITSAARGTPFADLGVALTKLTFGLGRQVPKLQDRMLEVQGFFAGTPLRRPINWLVRHSLKIDAVARKLTGRGGEGRLARFRARLAEALHERLFGGIESLATCRGAEIMNPARLQPHLAGIPILNTVGVVPASRLEMLTTRIVDQRFSWRFMMGKALSNDGQVPAAHQKLEPVLGSAVDLRTQAISHWGVIGATVPLIHNKDHFKTFSPELHTHALGEMVRRMDL